MSTENHWLIILQGRPFQGLATAVRFCSFLQDRASPGRWPCFRKRDSQRLLVLGCSDVPPTHFNCTEMLSLERAVCSLKDNFDEGGEAFASMCIVTLTQITQTPSLGACIMSCLFAPRDCSLPCSFSWVTHSICKDVRMHDVWLFCFTGPARSHNCLRDSSKAAGLKKPWRVRRKMQGFLQKDPRTAKGQFALIGCLKNLVFNLWQCYR